VESSPPERRARALRFIKELLGLHDTDNLDEGTPHHRTGLFFSKASTAVRKK